MKKRNHYFLHYNLQFFAKDGPGGEKTEEPTSKKLSDARKDGQVAKSMDLVTAVALIALFLILKFFVGVIGTKFMGSFKSTYSTLASVVHQDFDVRNGVQIFNNVLQVVMMAALPIYLAGFISSFLANYVQFEWKVTSKPLQPKLSKINPLKGLKRIINKDKLMELLKSVAKIAVIVAVVLNTLQDKWDVIMLLYRMSLFEAIQFIGTTVIDLGLKISFCFLIIGFVDFAYQKHKFKQDMKMTKQEVKDEYKNQEGDPQVKGQIKSRMREASRRRMMQELPKADVVITNPTHLAVALQYDREKLEAPVLIAKGADYIAAKIKDVAKENKIEIVENKPLARMIYYNVEIGSEIPPELYQAVAEVLAYVYNLKH